MRPVVMALGALAIAAVGTLDTPAHAQSRKQREDARTCASFGLNDSSSPRMVR
jgi:hypothetical protein